MKGKNHEGKETQNERPGYCGIDAGPAPCGTAGPEIGFGNGDSRVRDEKGQDRGSDEGEAAEAIEIGEDK